MNIKKLKEACKNRKISKETRKKISESNSGKKKNKRAKKKYK